MIMKMMILRMIITTIIIMIVPSLLTLRCIIPNIPEYDPFFSRLPQLSSGGTMML